jgi:hypothetical protein
MDQTRSAQNQTKSLLKKEFDRFDESRFKLVTNLLEKTGRISLNNFLRVMEEQS